MIENPEKVPEEVRKKAERTIWLIYLLMFIMIALPAIVYLILQKSQ